MKTTSLIDYSDISEDRIEELKRRLYKGINWNANDVIRRKTWKHVK